MSHLILLIVLFFSCGVKAQPPLMSFLQFSDTHSYFTSKDKQRIKAVSHVFNDEREIEFSEKIRKFLVRGGYLYVYLVGSTFVSMHDLTTLKQLRVISLDQQVDDFEVIENLLCVLTNHVQNRNHTIIVFDLSSNPQRSFWHHRLLRSLTVFKDALFGVGSESVLSITWLRSYPMYSGIQVPGHPIAVCERLGQLYVVYKGKTETQDEDVMDCYIDSFDLKNWPPTNLTGKPTKFSLDDIHFVLQLPDLYVIQKQHLARSLFDRSYNLMKVGDDLTELASVYPKFFAGVRVKPARDFKVKRFFELFPRLVQIEVLSFLEIKDQFAAILSLETACKKAFLAGEDWRNKRMHFFKTLMLYVWLDKTEKAREIIEGLLKLEDPLMNKLVTGSVSDSGVATTSQ